MPAFGMFDPARHFTPVYPDWDATAARAAIAEIATDALAAADPAALWPAHPLDDGMPDGLGCVYFGAAGVVWALHTLQRRGFVAALPDLAPYLATALARNAAWYADGPYPAHGSLLIGDLGILLVQMQVAPAPALADRIFAEAAKNTDLPVLELMWGAPGSMLACAHMARLTGQARFAALFRAQAARLLADLETASEVPIWTQDLYGRRAKFLGAVHGFAGNLAALLSGWDWLDGAQRQVVEDAATRTLADHARSADAGVNWPPVVTATGLKPPKAADPNRPDLCQHCHGAPGIVTSLAAAPFSNGIFENLLLGGGALTWCAGPLTKGSNLCHGTGGNGYALLKLYARTGEEIWLKRARAFAMAALAQLRTAREEHGRGRYSLWTGDAGLALYLADCIGGGATFPIVDVV